VLDADVEVDRREFTVRAALQVAPGERLALFGPSGAGKTTLLEAIAGLVQPRRARIELGGRVLTSTVPPACSVPPWQRRVGLLRQYPGLFPHLSVRENLCYAPSAPRSGTEVSDLPVPWASRVCCPRCPRACPGARPTG
jgi:molybdate transport system ATP-binding protein